jgi:hypothetical protein
MWKISIHASRTLLRTSALALCALPMYGQTANTGAIAATVCKIVRNPPSLQQEDQHSDPRNGVTGECRHPEGAGSRSSASRLGQRTSRLCSVNRRRRPPELWNRL